MSDDGARRPLKIRDVKIVNTFARYLSGKQITPNQISVTSILFAALAAVCFFCFACYGHWWLLILAGLMIQCRLLCNLFDGMVAVEGGKKTNSGELFNDIPDRIADPLILVAAGYAIHVVSFGAELGWCAGLLAVMTAYIRTLSASIGAPVDFKGPMAKQHRMAVLTIACVLTAVEILVQGTDYALLAALIVIVLGAVVTCIRRAVSAYRFLEA
ncbi:CDP-alcohol phosphatidyltransferase family protein [Gimesia panareensis]|uniref:CDP-alcohol phosphatidyltransferase family protein n=1 Tax=Gimesia panareensis TaxID=2527978 RepID=UPI00118BFD19|nr:CDP-alcohol phosphatidyltransferase family protein [Gimesia panareensis]QDU51798.1 CDP-alcohol phosphatidyltransferase [Gimesia panareensis]